MTSWWQPDARRRGLPRSRPAASHLAEPPPDPALLTTFPAYDLDVGAKLHRIHAAGYGVWYFNPDEAWRFNLCLLDGKGTCYLAEHPVAGLLESFKGMRSVDEADVQRKAHATIVLDRSLRMADCCVAGAAAHGVNAEIHTTTDYGKTQRWAGAFAQAGFEGIRYFCRSDPSLGLVGYALFDDAGVPPPHRWPTGVDRSIADDVLIKAEAYGLRVLPTP
jgi:RES domain-containing protein